MGMPTEGTRRGTMRRALVVLLGTMLLFPLGATGAGAARPEKYDNRFFNAYWNTRRKVDNDTYLRTTWYSGVYTSGEGDFWSDLYKDVERCQKLDGRDRCRQKTYWYDSINDIGSGSFTIDSRLDGGQLTATYQLRDRSGHDHQLIGSTLVTVDLAGVGNVSKSTERYTYDDGCNSYRYSGKSKSRDAQASGTYQIGTDAARSFGTTDNAYMSAGSSITVEHNC
jgi:hypothetical protein